MAALPQARVRTEQENGELRARSPSAHHKNPFLSSLVLRVLPAPMAANKKSALSAALAGGEAAAPPDAGRLRLDPKAFPCLAGLEGSGAVPALVAGADGLGALVSGFEQVDLRGSASLAAGSAPTAGLLSDGRPAVRVERESERGEGREQKGAARAPIWARMHAATRPRAPFSHSRPWRPLSRSLPPSLPPSLTRHTGRLRAQPAPAPGRRGAPAPGRVADGEFACDDGWGVRPLQPRGMENGKNAHTPHTRSPLHTPRTSAGGRPSAPPPPPPT
jgi:hypothetical protein